MNLTSSSKTLDAMGRWLELQPLPYKETGKEKRLLILLTYKMNVKYIKLYQMIPHSSNKGCCQRIMTEALLTGNRNAVL